MMNLNNIRKMLSKLDSRWWRRRNPRWHSIRIILKQRLIVVWQELITWYYIWVWWPWNSQRREIAKKIFVSIFFVHFLFYMNKNYPAMKTTTLYKDNVTYIKFMHFYPITTIIICCSKSSLFYSFSLILFFILFKLCFIFVLVVSIYACFESNAGCYLCLIQLVH